MSNKPSLKTITADLLEGGEVIRFGGVWCRVTSVTRKPSACGLALTEPTP
jgi:preprotein translocase subunit YajC